MTPKEFGDERFKADYNKKWYVPASGIPAFELDIYRGELTMKYKSTTATMLLYLCKR